MVLALGTSQRNLAASLMIASQNVDDPAVVVMSSSPSRAR